MPQQPNTGKIVNAYGYRLNEQQLTEEVYDPTTQSARAVGATLEYQLIAPATNNPASGNTQSTPVDCSAFNGGLLCINMTASSGQVTFQLLVFSDLLNAWLVTPINIPSLQGVYGGAWNITVLGKKMALSWTGGTWTGGATIMGVA